MNLTKLLNFSTFRKRQVSHMYISRKAKWIGVGLAGMVLILVIAANWLASAVAFYPSTSTTTTTALLAETTTTTKVRPERPRVEVKAAQTGSATATPQAPTSTTQPEPTTTTEAYTASTTTVSPQSNRSVPSEDPEDVFDYIEVDEFVEAFGGPRISPTAIVMHYTEGNYQDVSELVKELRDRDEEPLYPDGRWVQFFVDTDGVVYLLTKHVDTQPVQTMNDDFSWNYVSIGIELESPAGADPKNVAEQQAGLLANGVQYDSALELVRGLMQFYGISNEADLQAKRGVFGHYELNYGNMDPGEEFMERFRSDL